MILEKIIKINAYGSSASASIHRRFGSFAKRLVCGRCPCCRLCGLDVVIFTGNLNRLRLIHGYRGGTAIRDMLWTVYNKRSQVKRLVSISEGVTELVLREY